MAETNWFAILASGITGAALTQVAVSVRDAWVHRSEGKVTALLMALTLEEYASRCAHFHSENREWDYGTGPNHSDVPKLADYPDKTNWRALGVKLASSVLQLRVSYVNASIRISYQQPFGEHNVISEAEEMCLELGIEALKAAALLRSDKRLPPIPADGVRGYFDKAKADRDQRDAEFREKMKHDPNWKSFAAKTPGTE